MKLRLVWINTVITLSSLLGIVLILELFVFRVVFLPSDLPVLSTESGSVIKFVGGQTGTYRIRHEIEAHYRINQQGWNSGYPTYELTKANGATRICVIGDSYVEALQVNYKKSFSELLETYLTPLVDSVYRFGISGAPLSHYLYLLENEVSQYSPDIVVINLVHNDIAESIAAVSRATYDSSLAKLVFSGDKVVGLQVPQPYTASISSWIKRTAIFRYLWVRQQVRPQNLRRIWFQVFGDVSERHQYAGNIRVSDINNPKLPKVIEYVFSELQRYQTENNSKILIVMDGNRGQIQDATHNTKDPLVVLNELVQEYAAQYGLSHIDLSSVFSEDYNQHGIPFSFPHDGHWNSYAHRLVAETVGQHINQLYLYSALEK